MYKKTLTYVDFNDVERTEDFYFNFTEADLIKLDKKFEGGLKQLIEKIIKEKDEQKIADLFAIVVYEAYGEKSPDGRYFDKSKEVKDRFISSQAYSDIYIQLGTDAEEANRFLAAVVPKKYLAAADQGGLASAT